MPSNLAWCVIHLTPEMIEEPVVVAAAARVERCVPLALDLSRAQLKTLPSLKQLRSSPRAEPPLDPFLRLQLGALRT